MFYQRFYEEEFDEAGVLQGAKLRYPENFNFGYDVMDVLAELYPNKLAMLWRNDAGQEKRLSFRDFQRLSNQAANVFRAWGLSKGDVLMVSLKTHFEYWYIALAAHKLGLVLSPVFHLLSVEDFAYRMQKSKAKAMIVTKDSQTPQKVRQAAGQIGLSAIYTVRGAADGFGDFTAEVAKASSELERVETRADEPILLYFTSGTTGEPKGVLHDHAFTLGAIPGAKYMQDIGKESLHFATGNTAWEVVCGTKFYGQWFCEGALFVYDYERFHAHEVLRQFEEVRVTSIMAQPTVYRQMLEAGMDRYELSSINCYAVGGEKLTRDVAQGVLDQVGYHLFEGYAQSEAGLIAANSKNAGRKEGSVGKILPKYHVEVLKADGSFAQPLEHGEIVLVADGGKRPVGILMGYFEDPEADEALWDGNIFHTSDLGYVDEDGFLFYLGRSDGIIKTKGYRVSPFEIENELSHHPAVYECMAVGEEDAKLGQRIRVYVRLAEGVSPSEKLKEELMHFHNDHCSGFKKIREMTFVSSFQRNANGKLMRNQFSS